MQRNDNYQVQQHQANTHQQKSQQQQPHHKSDHYINNYSKLNGQNYDSNVRKNEKTNLAKRKPDHKKSSDLDAIKSSLDAGRFRLLNEMLYTQSSKESLDYFKDREVDMKVYHDGFRRQTERWTHQPLQIISEFIKENENRFKNATILDLGCGEGQLEVMLKRKRIGKVIESYDLVSLAPHVKVCDVKNIPRESESVDMVVFCLSLMGTNYMEFVQEANRLLKKDGYLVIAEVTSRFTSLSLFQILIRQMGFKLIESVIL